MTRERVAAHVGAVDAGEAIYVAALPDGPILVLEGVSAVAWRGLAAGGVAGMLAAVVEATGVEIASVEDDLVGFAEDLQARGLVQKQAD